MLHRRPLRAFTALVFGTASFAVVGLSAAAPAGATPRPGQPGLWGFGAAKGRPSLGCKHRGHALLRDRPRRRWHGVLLHAADRWLQHTATGRRRPVQQIIRDRRLDGRELRRRLDVHIHDDYRLCQWHGYRACGRYVSGDQRRRVPVFGGAERLDRDGRDAVRRTLVETLLHGNRDELVLALDDTLLGIRPRPASVLRVA